MEIVSGPGRRSVSPPIRWQPNRVWAARRPSTKPVIQPTVGAVGKRQRHQVAERGRALGCEVRDIDGQRLPRDVLRRIAGKEVHALGHRIGLEHELGARLRRQQRAIVLETEGARRGPRVSGASRAMIASSPLQRFVLWLVNCHRTAVSAGRGARLTKLSSAPAARRA